MILLKTKSLDESAFMETESRMVVGMAGERDLGS
jgi:hypothetical protein